jgi:predicted dinucleotide-binding enzyme
VLLIRVPDHLEHRGGKDVVGLRIGLIGTGEMGSAVGARLRANGVDVVTSLAGRSAASAERIALPTAVKPLLIPA